VQGQGQPMPAVQSNLNCLSKSATDREADDVAVAFTPCGGPNAHPRVASAEASSLTWRQLQDFFFFFFFFFADTLFSCCMKSMT
jgi:hypothetical protein